MSAMIFLSFLMVLGLYCYFYDTIKRIKKWFVWYNTKKLFLPRYYGKNHAHRRIKH